jgi:hypothetical protein
MEQHRAIYKNTSIEFLDAFYREDVDAAVQFGRGVLGNSSTDALSVAQQWATASSFDTGELQGFQSRWLDENSALSAHDVDRVLRYSYREALELANAPKLLEPPQPPKLVETFWVLGAGDEFEVHIHDGVDRVTMFMFVPLVRRYGSRNAATRSYVVRVGDLEDVPDAYARRELDADADPVLMIQVSGSLDDRA